MTNTAHETAIPSKRIIRWSPPKRTAPCPHCGSFDTETTSTRPGLRYHRCHGCGKPFQSIPA